MSIGSAPAVRIRTKNLVITRVSKKTKKSNSDDSIFYFIFQLRDLENFGISVSKIFDFFKQFLPLWADCAALKAQVQVRRALKIVKDTIDGGDDDGNHDDNDDNGQDEDTTFEGLN